MKKRWVFVLMMLMGVVQSVWAASADNLRVTVPDKADKVVFRTIEPGKLLVSVTDAHENAIQGLTREDFNVFEGERKTHVVKVEPLDTNKDVSLNVVLVVDNSMSMRDRKAVQSLLDAMEAVYQIVRPIDDIVVVVFDDTKVTTIDGHKLHAQVLQADGVASMRGLVNDAMHRGLTTGTYLKDAMRVGLDVMHKWPAKSNKFMAVFSDGEDLNSTIDEATVLDAARGIENFSVFTIDYMPTAGLNPFMDAFARNHAGKAWKATSADELIPIFKKFSSTLLHRYVVYYRNFNAPEATVTVDPSELVVEEMTTIDSAPLLNYVFFDAGRSELSPKYVQLTAGETNTFAESALTSVMEKYGHLLNIIGSRLRSHPEATVTLVGCNANVAEERGRQDLSRSRAESVRAYLHYIWGIADDRLSIEARNLPEMPSTSRIPEGQAENRRVEIHSTDPAILDTVKSEYVEKISKVGEIRIAPRLTAEAGIVDWEMRVLAGETAIGSFSGAETPAPIYAQPIAGKDLDPIVAAGSVDIHLRVTDTDDHTLTLDKAASVPVRFIRRQQQQAEHQGYKVREKYALILFDFDSAAIQSRNQTIVQRIVQRTQAVPQAMVQIAGYTDIIGKEAYNQKLSERRADAVKAQVAQAMVDGAGENLSAFGKGPHDPLYDNGTPEGRCLNRTVTITLEYEQQ